MVAVAPHGAVLAMRAAAAVQDAAVLVRKRFILAAWAELPEGSSLLYLFYRSLTYNNLSQIENFFKCLGRGFTYFLVQ